MPMMNLIRMPISHFRSALSRLKRLGADHSGSAAVVLAISLPTVIGMAALGTEAATWYMAKRTMQGAADAAAYTAATAKAAGASTSWITTEAKTITASYGLVDGQNGVTVRVNTPPSQGSNTSNTNAVEVIVQETLQPLLSALIVSTGPTVRGRSVAVANESGNGCILALDKGDVVDVTDSGNTTINMTSCSIFINSDDPSGALTISGGATINAKAAYIVGGTSISSNSHLNTTSGINTGIQPLNDPYMNVAVPSFTGCDQNNFGLSGHASQHLSASGSTPYVFCNGLDLEGTSTLTLDAGTYIIDRGTFKMAGGTTLNATAGATIVLTSSTGSSYATANIQNNAYLSITAPTTGSLSGMAIMEDRSAPSGGSSSITGGNVQNIIGAIYMPTQAMTFSGGTSSGGSQCTQIIAYTLNFSGSTYINSSCSGTGTQPLGLPGGTFIE